jgi:hypothetical protein
MSTNASRRSLSSFLFALALAALGSAGCSVGPTSTEGANGRAEFSYGSCFLESCTLDSRGIAAGSTTSISISSKSEVGSVASSAPGVLSVGALSTSGGASGTFNYSVSVAGGTPGTSTLTIYDKSGAEIDHVSVLVSATATIGVDHGWSGDGPTVIAGQTFTVHATTLGAKGETLEGDGAIHFAFDGGAQSSFAICFGDCTGVHVDTAGDGRVLMTAVNATNSITLHAIHAAAIDTLDVGDSSVDVAHGATVDVDVTARAGGVDVYGVTPTCVVANPATASVTILPAVSFATGATGKISVKGLAAGSTNVTCTVNGHAATFGVSVS